MSRKKYIKTNVKNDVDKIVENDVNKIFERLNSKNRIYSEKNTKSKPIDEATKKWNMNDKIVDLFKEKIENDNKLKSNYAVILVCVLIFQLIALNVWFVLRGIGILNFTDTTFNIFITGGIAEIYVLVRVIVKYLFKDNLTESLNIILENNNSQNKLKNNKKEYNKNSVSDNNIKQ